ncbi:hypothetical protein ACFLIM_48985 [Nonomuraea sp. M3C6]|uniref:Major facilitator superfamily (MFS) profile domain-containing protein n=1 Tax=Nonomuraea marmarensis TaxID=3351344 RepID=A0ABW7AVR5_9ACTN
MVTLLVQLIPIGIGGGLTVPPLTTALLQATADAASGILSCARQVDGALGVALVADHSTFLTGLHASALIGAVTLLITATILLLRDNPSNARTAW